MSAFAYGWVVGFVMASWTARRTARRRSAVGSQSAPANDQGGESHRQEEGRQAVGMTTDPNDPRLTRGVNDAPVEQADAYLVLPAPAEHPVGFVEPVRLSYVHAVELGGCGALTTMNQRIAETYALDPSFYGATYCVGCRMHRPVGAHGEFLWVGTEQRVGTRRSESPGTDQEAR